MKILYGIPLVIILVAVLFSIKEDVSEIGKNERYLIPFYKVIKKICKINFIDKLTKKTILDAAENYSEIYVRKKAIETAKINKYKTWSRCLMIISLCSILAMLSAFTKGDRAVASLIRNKTGEGQATYEIEAEIKGEKTKLPVTLEEEQYSEEEIEEWFDYGCDNIDSLILKDNLSLDMVEDDLELIDKLPGSCIEISWQCSDYSVIQPSGELIKENISKEGEKIKLVAVFSYMDYERKHEIDLVVKEKSYEGIDKYFYELKRKIAVQEKENRTENVYSLPKVIEGEKVTYRGEREYQELIILVLGMAVAILLPFRDKSALDKEKQKRNQKMLFEYPELVCKLSLYLGAGMNLFNAWEKIALDNINRLREKDEKSFLSTQIIYTYRQLQNGMLMGKAFDEFGNRCGMKTFKKLSMLINSNMKKGSSDLSIILEREAKEAFDKRKGLLIKRAGDASVKLMMPMFMELLVVIGVLIVPAFLTLEV